MLRLAPSLTDQIYDAIVGEICDGTLAPGTHLVQEQLADRFGVSRQPIQQAMTRLRADGMVEAEGKRGLFVTRLDPARMLQHYGVRAALDGYAARVAALRVAADPGAQAALRHAGEQVLAEGEEAVRTGFTVAQIRLDDAFHQALYAASGNPMVATTAEPHWRFLRRAMAGVLRDVAPAAEIWRQHAAILAAVLAGDAAQAERLALDHVEGAAARLGQVLGETA